MNKLQSQLSFVKNILDDKGLRWAIFAGAAAYIYGSGRMVTDVDILIHDDDLPKASQLLQRPIKSKVSSFGKVSLEALVISMEPIEIVASIKINIDGKIYSFSMDDDMISRINRRAFLNIDVPVLSIEDNIIFKAILQREVEMGKHDVSDIYGMLKGNLISIDKGYLINRVRKMRVEDRVIPLLKRLC
ncbi:MAG: nucleotidyltransferase family protein, partial [Nitrososphaerota archaeon]|nr:nucleotidyltransferase family protein [Nitrososphaerota archaeon]